MLKLKVKKKLPAIRFLEKINPQPDIQELFKPVKKLNFDGEKDDTDLCKEQWKGKNGERFRQKYIENQKIISKLTSEYRKTISEVREEMKVNGVDQKKGFTFLSETIEDLKNVLSKSKKLKAEDNFLVKVKDPIEIADFIGEEENEEDTDQEDSATWILLGAHCGEGDFKVSPPDYKTSSEEDDYLNRPRVDWNILNESVTKCQSWLNDSKIK